MNCLCCGKEIKETAGEKEKQSGWHARCVKLFFGTKELPKIDISEEQLLELANAAVNHGFTIPGVQKKMSLHLSLENPVRLTVVDYPTGYILKPQTDVYPYLPEYEDLEMRLAELAGIRTVPHGLIGMRGQYAYITKRVDRNIKSGETRLYAMEDFCQLSRRLTQDKYKGSYEGCGRIIAKYSEYPGLDMSELFLRVVFSYLTGNSDMHLKNFSLREMEPGNRKFCLSEAYDLLPVNLIIPQDPDQMALTINGKKRNLRRSDFRKFAARCGIPEKAADKMIQKMCSLLEVFLQQCDQSYLPETERERMKELIISRTQLCNNSVLS